MGDFANLAHSAGLFFDGANYYTCDYANRLTSVDGTTANAGFTYNGLGDRLAQTVEGETTTYALDLNAGLTQVLSDGDTTYLYGLARLSQETATPGTGALDTEYYLGDALGSVRQLTGNTGSVDYVASYTPYGEVLSSAGEGESVYGYVGEATDVTGLVFLRARFYSPWDGRFVTRDTWGGDINAPISYDVWLYSYGNPVNFIDPSGQKPIKYDRNFAAAYAEVWAGSYNRLDYGDPFHSGMADCTNFVSQALKAGGMPESKTWFFHRHGLYPSCNSSLWPLTYQCGEAWAATEFLYEELTIVRQFPYTLILGEDFENGKVPQSPDYIPVEMLEKTQPGDVVFYSTYGIAWNHAAFVVDWGGLTKVEEGKTYYDIFTPLVVDHSGAYTDFGVHSLNDTSTPQLKISIVHIPDEFYVPDEEDLYKECQ